MSAPEALMQQAMEKNLMYVYYVIRGTRAGEPVEHDGEIDEAGCPGVDLRDGPMVLDYLSRKIDQEVGTTCTWESSELTDSFFEIEDSYVYYDNRWMRRSDMPLKR
ncbi:MAG: hypothetical protein M3Y81_00210 [Chloroflexota bacterium]|nr:hypothetical protein [Chloroflexota bacterium]